MTRSIAIIASVALCSLLLAVLVAGQLPLRGLLADLLARETPRISSDRVDSHLREIKQLGTPALEPIVLSLGSERDPVVETAANILEEHLEEWRSLPVADSSVHVQDLAQLLAVHVDSFGPTARQRTARLATAMLLWPIDRSRIDGLELVRHCEIALKAAEGIVAPETDGLAAANSQRALDEATELPEYVQTEQSPAIVDTEQPEPNRPIPPPPAEPVAPLPHAPTPEIVEPRPFLLQQRAERDQGLEQHFPVYAPRTMPRPLILESPEPQYVAPSEEVPIDAPLVQQQLRALGETEVIRELHSPSTVTARAAERELMRRGYRTLDMYLARRFADPDPKERLKFVNELPSMRRVDARRWLLRLAEDVDQEVRKAAISILATSTDPNLLKRLDEIRSRHARGGSRLPY